MKKKIAFWMLVFLLALLLVNCAGAPDLAPMSAPSSQPQSEPSSTRSLPPAPTPAPAPPPTTPAPAPPPTLPLASPPSPPRPQSVIPDFLTVRLNGDGSGFTLFNADSSDHRVLVEYVTDTGEVVTRIFSVEAYSSIQEPGGKIRIRRIGIIDWI